MNYGFFGASFDPPTLSHLRAASELADKYGLDHVIMGPCSNDRPDKRMKTSDEHRWNMLKLAIGNNPLFIADDYEMKKKASEVFTYFTMEHYKSKYPGDAFFFMMGADVLIDLAKGQWEYGLELVQNNEFIVTSRDGVNLESIIHGSEFLRPYKERFNLFQQDVAMGISSTYIRAQFAQGRDARYLLPDECIEYINEHGLYR